MLYGSAIQSVLELTLHRSRLDLKLPALGLCSPADFVAFRVATLGLSQLMLEFALLLLGGILPSESATGDGRLQVLNCLVVMARALLSNK